MISSFFGACNDNYISSVPTTMVSLKIDLSGKYNTFKNSTNEFLTFEKPEIFNDRVGFAGIIIYSGINFDDNGNSIYYAFDMACTHEIKQDAKVLPVEGKYGEVKCTKCGSVYDVSLGFGNPISGPSKEKLRKYKVTVTETNLFVYQ